MELSVVQQRVVGSLIEKELTTPDNYPLSMNALLAACNQTTNRDPVLSLSQDAVENALANLRASGVVRVVYSKGMRVDKYRHVLHEVLELDEGELALVGVLLLRGPQTGAELRSRTERSHAFSDQREVDETLARLAAREQPVVQLLDRQPGQKEQRWIHLLGPVSTVWSGEGTVSVPSPLQTEEEDRIGALEVRVAALEAKLDELLG